MTREQLQATIDSQLASPAQKEKAQAMLASMIEFVPVQPVPVTNEPRQDIVTKMIESIKAGLAINEDHIEKMRPYREREVREYISCRNEIWSIAKDTAQASLHHEAVSRDITKLSTELAMGWLATGLTDNARVLELLDIMKTTKEYLVARGIDWNI